MDYAQKRCQNLIEVVASVASALSKGHGRGRAKPYPQHLPRLWLISLDYRKAFPKSPTPRLRKPLPSPSTRTCTHTQAHTHTHKHIHACAHDDGGAAVVTGPRHTWHSAQLGLVQRLGLALALQGDELVLGADLGDDAVQVQVPVAVYGQDDGHVTDVGLDLRDLLEDT